MKISDIVSSEAFSIFGSIAEMMAAGIAAWATVLLYFTLAFTRDTLREAKITNENSEKALSEAKKSLSHQVERANRLDRAWLCIEPPKDGILISSNFLTFNVENLGNTPILKCEIATDMKTETLTLSQLNGLTQEDIKFDSDRWDSSLILPKKNFNISIYDDLKKLTAYIDTFPIADESARKIAIFIIHAEYHCELTSRVRETKVAFGIRKTKDKLYFIGLPKYMSYT